MLERLGDRLLAQPPLARRRAVALEPSLPARLALLDALAVGREVDDARAAERGERRGRRARGRRVQLGETGRVALRGRRRRAAGRAAAERGRGCGGRARSEEV